MTDLLYGAGVIAVALLAYGIIKSVQRLWQDFVHVLAEICAAALARFLRVHGRNWYD